MRIRRLDLLVALAGCLGSIAGCSIGDSTEAPGRDYEIVEVDEIPEGWEGRTPESVPYDQCSAACLCSTSGDQCLIIGNIECSGEFNTFHDYLDAYYACCDHACPGGGGGY